MLFLSSEEDNDLIFWVESHLPCFVYSFREVVKIGHQKCPALGKDLSQSSRDSDSKFALQDPPQLQRHCSNFQANLLIHEPSKPL